MKPLYPTTLLIALAIAGALSAQPRKKVTISGKGFPKTEEVYYVLKDDNTKKDGPYEVIRNENIVLSGFYKNDQKDSVWEVYAPNNILLSRKWYQQGKRTGKWEFFTRAGEVDWTYDFNTNVLVRTPSGRSKITDTATYFYMSPSGNWVRDSLDRVPVALYSSGEWLRYLNTNLRYPDEAVNHNEQGQVIINITVDETGDAVDLYGGQICDTGIGCRGITGSQEILILNSFRQKRMERRSGCSAGCRWCLNSGAAIRMRSQIFVGWGIAKNQHMRKITTHLIFSLFFLTMMTEAQPGTRDAVRPGAGKEPIKVTDLLKIKSIGDIKLNKDGSKAVFVLTSIEPDPDPKAGKWDYKYMTTLYLVPADGSLPPRPLTAKENASAPGARSPDWPAAGFCAGGGCKQAPDIPAFFRWRRACSIHSFPLWRCGAQMVTRWEGVAVLRPHRTKGPDKRFGIESGPYPSAVAC